METTLFLSAFGFILSIYIKFNYEKVQKRNFILTKLETYLVVFEDDIRSNDIVKKVVTSAANYERRLIKNQEIPEGLEEKAKIELDLIKKELLHENSSVKKNMEELFNSYKKYEELYNFEKSFYVDSLSHIINNKIYLSEDEASLLPLNISNRVILSKSHMYDVNKCQVAIMCILKDMEEFDFKIIHNSLENQINFLYKWSRNTTHLKKYIIENKNRNSFQNLIYLISE